MDRRLQVLNDVYIKWVSEKNIVSIYPPNFPEAYKDAAINAMDAYMKECVTEAFEYVVKNTTGHSIDKGGKVEFKFKGEWISTEQLFQNFI